MKIKKCQGGDGVKVLLVDIDSNKIPNLALMKISGFYKTKGSTVTLYRLGYTAYLHERKSRKYINAKDFDKVFISCIFDCNKDIITIDNCDEVYKGGTGYDYKIKLDSKIDFCDPDYSIYPDNQFSYGFLTRGCIRKCSFCVVPKKEGDIRFNRTIDQIVKHKKVRFLDNNFLSFKGSTEILKELIDRKIRCQFYQGLDLRLINKETANLLSQLNYIGEYTFAFDDVKLMPVMNEKIKILKRFIKRDWKIRVFIYCKAEMNIKHEVLPRIKWCKDNKVLPYLMRDNNCYSSDNRVFYNELTRWCCQPGLFKKCTFDEFLVKRTITNKRKNEVSGIYNAND